MIVVDKADMESLSDRDVSKLLRWSAEELMRRFNSAEAMYRIEYEISEVLIDTNFKLEILHD